MKVAYFTEPSQVNELIEVVKAAGKRMCDASLDMVETEEKSGWGDFVTQFDLEIQSFLYKELKKLYPEVVFKAEESGFADVSVAGSAFIVDPIDGTLNFLRHRGDCAVSVAYAERGETLVGVVYDPWRNELFQAFKGHGALLNGKPIRVSSWPFTGGIVNVGNSRYRKQHWNKTKDLLNLLWEHAVDIRRLGACSIDLCHVACGRSELYSELMVMPWDYAAGALIVEEAGGMCSRLNGDPLGLAEGGSLVAGNPAAYQEFMDISATYDF
ncbi:MAG: inositol monophosphatase family protein [Fastidiosipilaceae bacterium]|nr:inositol monophosphatase [Clostridiaceae bacterium]